MEKVGLWASWVTAKQQKKVLAAGNLAGQSGQRKLTIAA